MAKVYYDHDRRPLTACEYQQAVRILEGHALEHTPPLAPGEMLERDLVLALILMLLSNRPYWEGTATDLQESLRSLAAEEQLDMTRDPDWPRTPALLCTPLTRLTDWMAEAGIEYHMYRTQYQRLHRLTMEGAAGDESEQEGEELSASSVPHTATATGVSETPGNDAHDAVADKIPDEHAAQSPLPRKSLLQQIKKVDARIKAAQAAEREASRLKAIQAARWLEDQELLKGKPLDR